MITVITSLTLCPGTVTGSSVSVRRGPDQTKEETCVPPEMEDGGEEAKNYTSVAPTMWLGAQNGW